MDSITYYNKNAQDFYHRTINVDMQDVYQKFLKYLPFPTEKKCILDAGCGVGRDSKFFLNKGYEVVSFDGSIEMVKMTSDLLGQDALHMLFQDINFSHRFDAVWANASLLHVPYMSLRQIIQKFHEALFSDGIFYASFKYGSSMRQVEDRVFFDMDEASIEFYIKGLFCPLEMWRSPDTRSKNPSPDKSWLHFITKKV